MEQISHQGGELQSTHTRYVTPPEQTPLHPPEDQESPESHDEQVIVTTIGDTSPEDSTDHQTDDHQHQDEPEPDPFPWTDAAHWNPTSLDDELARDRLDALFMEIPDQEIGTVEHMGWFGLLKHEGRPGGVVLSQNAYGFRYVWETDSDEQLAQHWDQLQREYHAFTTATRARSSGLADHNHDSSDQRHPYDRTEDNQREETTSSHYPEIWVGSLSDYNNGHLHGTWLDATLDPDELHHAVQFILRNGHDPTAEEWAIMDYDDFCGLNLGEYESLEVVSRIAQGIAGHGEAFAKWVSYVGERSEDLLTDERFQDHYLGHFDSTEAYAEYILEETDFYHYLDEIPESLRMYAKFDTEQMARDMEIELYIVEADDGGVHIFDPRG